MKSLAVQGQERSCGFSSSWEISRPAGASSMFHLESLHGAPFLLYRVNVLHDLPLVLESTLVVNPIVFTLAFPLSPALFTIPAGVFPAFFGQHSARL